MNSASRPQLIVLVDSNEASLAELSAELRRAAYETTEFGSAEACLSGIELLSPDVVVCVITEFTLATTGGLDLQAKLNDQQRAISTIFFTNESRTADVVRAMKNGAVSVIEKREGTAALISILGEALEHARESFESAQLQRLAQSQLRSLNVGEQEVLHGILKGKLNKEIAQHLNLSVRTIEQRRRQVFRKLDVQHPASLATKVLQASHLVGSHSISDAFDFVVPAVTPKTPLVQSSSLHVEPQVNH